MSQCICQIIRIFYLFSSQDSISLDSLGAGQGNPLGTVGLFSRILDRPTHRLVDDLKDIYPSGPFAPISITWEARPTFYLNTYFIS